MSYRDPEAPDPTVEPDELDTLPERDDEGDDEIVPLDDAEADAEAPERPEDEPPTPGEHAAPPNQ